ncbi:pericentrin-like isoform X4 [Maniola jurtina]|uniref:pericentrin-like isoform X4 n=1 Tax=Maniola jurtina TaxID=191418 RepID=UPI001E686202|nr:pericentrin-like isoform X4 [Maniola jurtina]
MDETQKDLPQTSENKHVLPDVVHSQQIPTVEAVDKDTGSEIVTRESEQEVVRDVSHDNDDVTTESISEHIPQAEYSITESEPGPSQSQDLPKPETSDNIKDSSLNPPLSQVTALSPNQQDSSHHSTSWNLEIYQSDNRISEESPVILALSSDTSKDAQKSKPISKDSSNNTPQHSPRSEYVDSLNFSLNENPDSTNLPNESSPSLEKSPKSLDQCSSGSEEIIKLDIRGQGAPKFPLQAAKIIFGPPPSGSTVIGPTLEQIPVFQNLLSPCLVGANEGVKIEEVFEDSSSPLKECTPDKSLTPSSGSEKIEQDVLIEEIIIEDDLKEKCSKDVTPPKSFIPDETMSFTTMSTDYKTICEEFNVKLVHLEEAIAKRDELIEELTVSLQRSVDEREHLKHENDHLTNEVQNLQHIIGEKSQSEHDTIKAHLSDFIKYQSLIKGDSTKYYSALMSGTTSLQSSNGEKDMDREEITVNYSKSDLRSSSSDEFQTGFENKLTLILNNFEGCIEDNMKNKLRESLIHLLCDEIGKMRVDFDTDIKELETQMKQDKQASIVESRRLRELLSSVKAGNADIDALREELSVKHEKEMENLRTYFEKKCSDMERRKEGYSEEVWHARSRVSPAGSACELEYDLAAGDAKRRTRSVDFSSLNMETSTLVESTLKQINKKLEHQLLEMKAEHIAYVDELQARHRETVVAFEDQITRLKAHIQTTDNTEHNVSLYQQDIDLELEKVLLSDPDAELSSWPLELVALRDRIHADKSSQEKELSIREEAPGEADKWRQRRNNSFDQNRQLEEVTKERDGLRRVAATLQRAVTQLVAYCASAEDELNRTVLAHLLGPLLHDQTLDFESRPSSPNKSDLNTSVVSRGKHVHFAPDLDAILVSLDEEGVVGFLQQQRDISLDIKNELEHSLKRLRNEAQELLELSARLTSSKARQESKMLESNPVQITELVEELEIKPMSCENCQLQRKNMEEAMSECLQRENLLRSDLEAAMVKIALLLGERAHSDVIAEGYGTGPGTVSAACRSLDDVSSPRTQLSRVAHDLDAALRDRDDLQQQLEAANRQLKSTRQFVEEQAAERETERDEFAARLQDMREENARLASRLQTNARILGEIRCLRLASCNCRQHDAHVEQLETQTREMNQIIAELETKKAATDDQLKTTEEKIGLLRDIIADLENQLEQKTLRETEVLEQLEQMKKTIDERDRKMRAVLGELESLRSERVDQSEVTCLKCCQEEDRYMELVEKIKEQARCLEEKLARSTRRLERAHERSSACTSERTEDVSLHEQQDTHLEMKSPESNPSPRVEPLSELSRVWERLEAHSRAEEAALKRIADLEMQRAQLKDIAQEVRAERDVLQARMSEQALRISSLSARLQQQRNDAEALAHSAASQLSVQLHDTQAEVQRLKEELEAKDKQLQRIKQSLEERDKNGDQNKSVYGNSCNPKDKVIILERELSNAQSKIAQLESIIRGLESDKDKLQATVREQQRALAEKEEQLNEIMALKLEDEYNQKSEIVEGKASARTLSDIVSISEFDEQDLQMRRAELKAQNISPNAPEFRDKTLLNRTLAPEVQRPNMSSLNVEFGEHFDVNYTPRADSLPVHLTSTQNRVLYTRNANETTIFGNSAKHSTAQNIPDNCSMYPNRDVNESKDINVEPKKINFSLEPCDNKMVNEEFTSLRELGITLDIKQENFPDILTQLKHEIKKSKTELDVCKSELKNAEEQLCEFPALKEEVEELKGLLENTMATMENDKKFYENQLESFSSNKKLLEQRLTEMAQEASEKSKDLHLLKEDILRRENMILELAKEKRNLTTKLSDLEVKISELQSRNTILEKCEIENKQLREKINELQKLEQLVTEKNHQIDSLNQHLDRLDDLQRCLNDKNEELANIKAALEEKTNELFQMQDSVGTLTRDIAKVIEENDQLSSENKELKLQLSKLEKEQENASLKLQNSETELERVNSLNSDLALRIEELKLLNDKLKDKETEIEILQEDFNLYHNEIAALREQLKMVSRSPSPRNKNGEDKKTTDRQANSDKRQLAKIKKHISLLQHELDFHKKELNDKAFELAKAKLDLTEARTNLSQLTKDFSDKDAATNELQQLTRSLQQQLDKLTAEKQQLTQQLEVVIARLREESDVSELKEKLRAKAERCRELEAELINMKELVERVKRSPSVETSDERRALAVRSPTAELERALRDQLNYSHTLDEDIMEQILSASSDEREDIPRLALNSSNRSTSSIHSSSSERLHRLRSDNEKLELQVNNLECRLQDKDALITELNRVRDKLSQECQSARLRLEAERDNSARLALLLDSHKDTADTLHNQDSSMIDMLKRRLESAMKSELEVQEREQALQRRLQQLERALPPAEPTDKLRQEMENSERLKGEISLLKCKLDMEQRRCSELQAQLEHVRSAAHRDADTRTQLCTQLKEELAELRRLKHETGVELARSKELLHTQSTTIVQLEKKLAAAAKARNIDTFTVIENEKTELAREISSLRRCLTVDSPDAASDKQKLQQLQLQVQQLRAQLEAKTQQLSNDEKEQAIRYLHGRWARLESCRKALVWQKRYLQRVIAGYAELERKLQRASDASSATPPLRGLKKFKCVAWALVASARMSFLVRRRETTRALAANALFRQSPAGGQAPQPMTPFSSTPAPRELGPTSRATVARRLLNLKLPSSPSGLPADSIRRSTFGVNSPREEQVLLSSPRSDAAAAYMQRLDAVSRRLRAATPRDNVRDNP